MSNVTWSLQHKRDTAANFTSNNPTLLAGQFGIETDGLTTTPKFKIGDGVTAWGTLPYFGGGSGLTTGTTTIAGGTNTRILYNNNGVLGEYTLTGTGTAVAMGTSPVFTTDITIGSAVLTGGSSGVVAVKPDVYFSYNFFAIGISPVDNVTYYLGSIGFPGSQDANTGLIRVPYDCTLIGYSICNRIGGTTGSGESISFYMMDDASPVTLSTAIIFNSGAAQNYHDLTLNTAVAANSLINVRMVSPTWVTNPTACYLSVTLHFKRA